LVRSFCSSRSSGMGLLERLRGTSLRPAFASGHGGAGDLGNSRIVPGESQAKVLAQAVC
jgi:hypothetical protein